MLPAGTACSLWHPLQSCERLHCSLNKQKQLAAFLGSHTAGVLAHHCLPAGPRIPACMSLRLASGLSRCLHSPMSCRHRQQPCLPVGSCSVCSMPRYLHSFNAPHVLTAALPLQVLVFGTTPQVRQTVLHGLLKQSPQAAAAPPPRAARQMPMLAGMGRPSAAEDGDLAAGLVRDRLTEAVRPMVACD